MLSDFNTIVHKYHQFSIVIVFCFPIMMLLKSMIVCVFMNVCVHICVFLYVYMLCEHDVYMCVHTCVCVCAYVSVCVCLSVCTHACAQTYKCMCLWVICYQSNIENFENKLNLSLLLCHLIHFRIL